MARPRVSTPSVDPLWLAPVACLFLGALTALTFWPTFKFGFVNYDDPLYVFENPSISRGLKPHSVAWAFAHFHAGNWHPLTTLSHMLDCQLFGLHPGGPHFINVALHATAAILLFLILKEMTGSLGRSLFVAAVFAIHPLRVESVAWIAERKDALSGVFFMLTIWSYLHYARKPSSGRYLIIVGLFALGLMSKPMLVTLPFALLLLDYWPLRRIEPRTRLWPEKAPLMAMSAASCLATLAAQKTALHSIEQFPLAWRLGNAAVAVATYIVQMIWPFHLAVFYPHAKNGLPLWQIWAALILIVSLTAFSLAARKRFPYLFVGWLWFVGMLIPVIGIVQVGEQAHADRYTYLPQIGLYLAIVWLVCDLAGAKRWRQPLLALVAPALVAGCVYDSRVQISHWRDSETLWRHALAMTRDNDTAHNGLADALFRAGQTNEAETEANLALNIRPDSAEAHSLLGLIFSREGKLDEALAHYQEVLRARPHRPRVHYNIATVLLQKGDLDGAITNFKEELEIQPQFVDAHNNLGIALSRQGDTEAAIAELRAALRLDPDRSQLHYNLASVYRQRGELDAAIAEYQQELKVSPNSGDAHNDLAVALSQKGQISEAVMEWKKALTIQPDNLNAQCNLAWVFATSPEAALRDGTKALELAQSSVQRSGGNDPRILRILAAAYAETGQFANAIQTAERGLELAEAKHNDAVAESLRNDLDSFRANTPVRTPR